jgi:uncharacterized repeat protein (TIGR01451 family)
VKNRKFNLAFLRKLSFKQKRGLSRRRSFFIETLERRLTLDATISGIVFNDGNASDSQDVGEDGLGGVTVELFHDLGTVGQFDEGIDTLVTSTTSSMAIGTLGRYSFNVTTAGYYLVRQQTIVAGFVQFQTQRVQSILVSPGDISASPTILNIDTFDAPAQLAVATTPGTLSNASGGSSAIDIIGTERDLVVTASGSPGSVILEVDRSNNNTLIFEASFLTTGSRRIIYDGVDSDKELINPTGLGMIDLLNGGEALGIRLTIGADIMGADITIAVLGASGTLSYFTQLIPHINASDPLQTLLFPFASFIAGGDGAVDFTKVGAIEVDIETSIPTNGEIGFIDTYGQTTIARNFGNVPAMTIGNQVFRDLNNNGLLDGMDSGIGGVTVLLYDDTNGNALLDSEELAAQISPSSTTTSTSVGTVGQYSFTDLLPVDYIVVIPNSQFATSASLDNLTASIIPASSTGNNANTGTLFASLGVASAVTLVAGDAPTSDGDSDPYTDLSRDFGFTPPTISIVKDDNPNTARVGEPLTYTLTVTNTSPRGSGRDSTSTIIEDTLPTGLTLSGTPSFTISNPSGTGGNATFDIGTRLITANVGSLVPGQIATLTIIATVGATFANPTSNTGHVNNAEGSTGNFQISTPLTPNVDLGIAKIIVGGATSVGVGETLTYRLTITNNTNLAVTGVTVNDDLPTGFTPGTLPSGVATGTAPADLVWSVGNLAANGTATVDIPANVSSSIIPGTTFTNTATIVTTGQTFTDLNSNNNQASVSIAVEPRYDLLITKTDSLTTVTTGQQYTYTLSVNNSGPSAATNVVVSDILPATLEFISASSGGTNFGFVNGQAFSGTIASLASGATTNIALIVRVRLDATGSITNTATVTADNPNQEIAGRSNTATDTDILNQPVTLNLTSDDSTDTVIAGGANFFYTITAFNSGDVNATDSDFTNVLPNGIEFISGTFTINETVERTGNVIFDTTTRTVSANLGTLLPGNSTTNRALITLNVRAAATAAAGLISNVVRLVSEENTTGVTDTETTQIIRDFDVSVSMNDNNVDTVAASQAYVYTIVVNNTGTSTATNIAVTDPLPTNLTFVSATTGFTNNNGIVSGTIASLNAGSSTTITISTRVNNNAPNGTTLNNTVTVAASGDSNTGNNTASATAFVALGPMNGCSPTTDFRVHPSMPSNAQLLLDRLVSPQSQISVVPGSERLQAASGQAGTFTGLRFSQPGIIESFTLDDGIVLTTGHAEDAACNTNYGSSSDPASSTTQSGSDADLLKIATGTINDASVFEFRFSTSQEANSIRFDLVFGSEEFPEFTNSRFNDIVGIFLDNEQIAFDSVGRLLNINNNFFLIDNSGIVGTPESVEKFKVDFRDFGYDALTTSITTTAPLNKSNQTHTLKFVIADVADSILDSGLFVANLRATTDRVGMPVSGGSVSGKVFVDTNENGSQDVGEPGLGSQIVYLDSNGDRRLNPDETSTSTDQDGNYVIESVPQGVNFVRAMFSDDFQLSSPLGANRIDVSPGKDITGIDFVLIPFESQTGSIEGLVYFDTNGDGIRQSTELPTVGAHVFADHNFNSERDDAESLAITDAQGFYRLTVIPTGNFQVSYSLSGGVSPQQPIFLQTTDFREFRQPNFFSEQNVDFGLFQTATVSGSVYDDINANGVKESTEAFSSFLGNGRISLTDQAGNPVRDATGKIVPSVLPNASGYSFRQLVPNSQRIRMPGGTFITGSEKYVVRPEFKSGIELTADLADLFSESSFVPTGTLAGHVAYGDLDFDGLTDLVVANEYASPTQRQSTVSVLLNDPDNPGNFQVTRELLLPIGSRPQSIAVNRDFPNLPLILVALIGSPPGTTAATQGIYGFDASSSGGSGGGGTSSASTSNIAFDAGRFVTQYSSLVGTTSAGDLFKNQLTRNGSRTIPVSTGAIDGPSDFVISDLDSDGKPEILVTNVRSHNLLIQDAERSSRFEALQLGIEPLALVAGSLDADDRPDFAIASFDGYVDYYLSKSHTLHSIFVGARGPTDVKLADMDLDGHLDIVANDWEDGLIHIYYLNEAGERIDQKTLTLPSGSNPIAIAISNANGLSIDRFPDIITANETSGAASLWINRDGKNFRYIDEFEAAKPIGATYGVAPREIVSTDLNGDRIDDLVIANRIGGISVFINQAGARIVENLTQGVSRTIDFGMRSISGNQTVGGVFAASGSNSSTSNQLFPDVSADGELTPIDALIVINELKRQTNNTHGEGEGSLSRHRCDTNGDGYVTPLDVLVVINQLKRTTFDYETSPSHSPSAVEMLNARAALYDSVYSQLGESPEVRKRRNVGR